MNKIHIGDEIKNVLNSSDISVTEFAKKINKSRGNIYSIFSRNAIETDLLLTISEVLNFDFFQLYSNSSKELKMKIEDLEKQNQLLSQLNHLLMEKYESDSKVK
jgi:IS30 family transposase